MFVRLYWIMPLVASLMWLGTLLGLLLNWITNGKPYLPSFNRGQHIAYISDTGAYSLKPLFIAGSVITVVLLDASLIAERWLRHRGKLAPNTSWTQKIFSIIAIIAGIAGALGLILLSIFDTYRHPTLHDHFLILFIVGYVVSAIFVCAEYQRLGIHFREHRILRISFWLKLFFIIIEVALAIGFGIESYSKEQYNRAAILEWVLALVFTFYVFSFFLDLLPAVRTKNHYSEETVTEMAGRDVDYSSGIYDDHTANGYMSGHANGNGRAF